MTPVAKLRELIVAPPPSDPRACLVATMKAAEARLWLALYDAATNMRGSPNHRELCRCVLCEDLAAALAALETTQ